MRLLKWTPFFDIEEESLKVLVKSSSPSLHLHMINPQIIDQATASYSCPYVVDVLVVLDITTKYLNKIDGFRKHVIFAEI
ncbi:hypothetical protein IEQ34_002779 [Dendrobium chrysotoxum]|uniref:Uncharacterized protein n=1 Tax=Dendrobium chrysotoxum TaxID=161865 RepID=A0AAV7HFG1_DENCH|nr:hypothetical protein IEQ34_002779 [Dendrobium chrysotoxum]